MTAPSASHFKTCLLIDEHLAVCRQILKVDRTLPVHIQIGFSLCPSSCNTVPSIHITANHVVIEIAWVCGNCDYWQIVVSVLINICARDNTAWKFVVREQSQS